MKKFLAGILLAIMVSGTAVAGQVTHTASLTLDQPYPVFGQSISLTGIYGKVYNGRQPQLPNQPQVQINCGNADGTMNWQDNQWVTNKISLGQSWNQTEYYFTLGSAAGSNGDNWSSGAAHCNAVLFYFDANFVLYELAFASFDVGP